MKNIYLLLFFPLIACSQERPIDKINYAVPSQFYTKNKMDSLLSGNIAPSSINIVALGTSLTEGDSNLGGGGVAVDRPTQSWPAQLASLIGKPITNLGYGGATLEYIMNNEVPSAIAAYAPGKLNIAIVEGGTNNWRIAEKATSCYVKKRSIMTALANAGYTLIDVTSPAMNNSSISVGVTPAQADSLRLAFTVMQKAYWKEELLAKSQVDIAADPILGVYVGPGNQNQTYYQPDGVHMNPTGYLRMAKQILPALNQVIKGDSYGTVTATVLPSTFQGASNVSVSGSDVVISTLATPAGITNGTNIRNDKYVKVKLDSLTRSNGIALEVNISNDQNYQWSVQPCTAGVFQYSGAVYSWINNANNFVSTGTVSALGWLKIACVGNDIVISSSPNDVTYTMLKTFINAAFNKSTLYPKIVFTSPATGQRLNQFTIGSN